MLRLHYNFRDVMQNDGIVEIIDAWCRETFAEYAVILGSGLKFPSETDCAEIIEIPYDQIPGFGRSNVKGHSGVLKLVTLNGRSAFVFCGRMHMYEGFTFPEVIRPVEFASSFGIEKIILTNSAGGLNEDLDVGDLLLLEDFIMMFDLGEHPGNFTGVDVEFSADAVLSNEVEEAASRAGVRLKRGTYAFMPGPAYETPAEVNMLRKLGADVVGMSTVPEWRGACNLKMKVAAISLVTNVHCAEALPPSHEEVLRSAAQGGGRLSSILKETMFGKA